MHLLVTATSLKVDTLQYLKREKDLYETPSPLENRCVIVDTVPSNLPFCNALPLDFYEQGKRAITV
jgi:hypothetical protein